VPDSLTRHHEVAAVGRGQISTGAAADYVEVSITSVDPVDSAY
jgi:hypothetical protein